MKRIFAILAAAAALLAIASSCEKYEDGRPPKAAVNEFERMYPDAFDVEWDYEGAYWEVSFETGTRPNGIEHDARFDLAGNWIETITEMFYNSIPQEIKDAFTAKYGDARLEDNSVDFYQTPEGDYYRFEIILGGVRTVVEVSLAGKSSVTPSKAAENGFGQVAPEGDVWDVEWDFEGTYWEVSFEAGTRPDGTEYTMYFDLEGNWLGTKTEIRLNDVPQNVLDAFKASEYGKMLCEDEVDYYRTPSGEFYRFELLVDGREAEVDVTLDGKVTLFGYDN